MKLIIKEKKRRGTEFFDKKTGSDKETWNDIDSPEDDEWAKKVCLTTYLKKEDKDNKPK